MFSSAYYQIVFHVIFIKYMNSILKFSVTDLFLLWPMSFGVGSLIIYLDKLVDDLGFYVYFIGCYNYLI